MKLVGYFKTHFESSVNDHIFRFRDFVDKKIRKVQRYYVNELDQVKMNSKTPNTV